ncbi:MAG TPA: hypothetical protein VGB98_26345 [Pyrinomonadaceae bacterium]|jgi:uncharacterized membrane protein YidH (DUF202 family)
MLRRADTLTALGFTAFSVAMLAVVIFAEQGFGIHVKYIPPAGESAIIATFLLAALAANVRALSLRGKYEDYSREPWNDLSLVIINCGIGLTSAIALVTVFALLIRNLK